MALDQDALNTLRLDKNAVAQHAERRAAPWLWVGLIIFVAAVAIAAWYLTRTPPVPVRTAMVQRTVRTGPSSASVLTASGYVVARRVSTPSSKSTAQVRSVHVEEGMIVHEGEVLAQLDDAIPKAQLALAQSQLEMSRRSVTESQVRLTEAERTLKRNQVLRAQNLVSQSVLDASDAEVKALKARIKVAKSEVDVAQRSVALAQQSVDDTTIRAPFTGVVISKNAQPGEMISPISAGGGFTRTGICTIVDMDSLEIEVDVNEAYLNRVSERQRAEAVLDAYPDWKIDAHVINIVPTADRQKATVKVRIGFDVKDPRILPDMAVQVRFLESDRPEESESGGAQPDVAVPESAIVNDGGQDYVFVVRGDRVERRAIAADTAVSGSAGVRAGLQAGETIVEDPPPGLADGVRIEIRK